MWGEGGSGVENFGPLDPKIPARSHNDRQFSIVGKLSANMVSGWNRHGDSGLGFVSGSNPGVQVHNIV